MRAEEKKILTELTDTVKNLYTAVIGNEELRIEGLLARQDRDDLESAETREVLRKINESLEKQIEHNDKTDERLEKLESFAMVFQTINGIKKKTVAFIIASMAGLGSIIKWWNEIKGFLGIQ